MGKLLLLFTIVPIVELYLLGKLTGIMGLGSTLALVLVTGILGASLARAQGRQVLQDWQRALSRGEVPESGVTDALLVVVGGVLLVTPGVLTDVVGLSLLLPPPRRLIGRMLVAHFRRQIEAGHIRVAHPRGFAGGSFDPFAPPGGDASGGPSHVAPPVFVQRSPLQDADREEIRVQATVRDVEPDADES